MMLDRDPLSTDFNGGVQAHDFHAVLILRWQKNIMHQDARDLSIINHLLAIDSPLMNKLLTLISFIDYCHSGHMACFSQVMSVRYPKRPRWRRRQRRRPCHGRRRVPSYLGHRC